MNEFRLKGNKKVTGSVLNETTTLKVSSRFDFFLAEANKSSCEE